MTGGGSAGKPVPVPEEADRPYWDGLALGRLVLSRCTGCGSYSQRARPVCGACRAESFVWSKVSGHGKIYSYTVARQTWVTGFQQAVPYVLVAVAIDEQPSLLLTTNLVGEFDVEQIDVDLGVTAAFEPRGDVTLLQFELDRARHV